MALLFLHLRSSQNVTLKKLPSSTKPPLLSKHNMLSWLHCEGLMMLLPTKKKRLNLDGSTNNLLRQEGNCSVHLKSPECNTHTTCYPYTILTVHTLKLCKTVMHCWVNHSAHCQVNLRWVKCGWRARSVWCTQLFYDTEGRLRYLPLTLLLMSLFKWKKDENCSAQGLKSPHFSWGGCATLFEQSDTTTLISHGGSLNLWAECNCTVHTREFEICGTKYS